MIAGWVLVRCLVTVAYMVAIGFAFLWNIDGQGMPFPFAVVSYTAAYGILMALLWLYERYPPRR